MDGASKRIWIAGAAACAALAAAVASSARPAEVGAAARPAASRSARAESSDGAGPGELSGSVASRAELPPDEEDPGPQAEAAASEVRVEDLGPGELAALVRDLAHDDVHGNAAHAYWVLKRAGERADGLLQAALVSQDRQQRGFAALLLARRQSERAPRSTAAGLIEVFDDGWPFTATERDAATVALAWLTPRARDVSAELCAAFDSSSWDARRIAAVALVRGGARLGRAEALDALLECLRDNWVRGDACLAFDALATQGVSAAGALERAWPGEDEQQRRLLAQLIALYDPSDPRAQPLTSAELGELGLRRSSVLPVPAFAVR